VPLNLARTIQRIPLPGDPGLRYSVNRAYYSVTGMKIHLEKAADTLFMHVPRKGSLLSSNIEGSNQSALMILISWMFLRNLSWLSSAQTQKGGRRP
jgi:hypothetical protein